MAPDPATEAGPGARRYRELVRRERQDMAWLVHCVAAMYDEISGGRISKPMTYPSEVVGQFSERLNEAADEAVAAYKRDLAKQIRARLETPWSVEPGGLSTGEMATWRAGRRTFRHIAADILALIEDAPG